MVDLSAFLDLVAALMAVLGAFFLALAALALFRMPDIYSRLSATSKAVTLGASMLLGAAAVGGGDAGLVWRALAGIAFLFLTSPIVGHVLGRAAWRSGVEPVVVYRDPFPTDPLGDAATEGPLGPDGRPEGVRRSGEAG